MKRNPLLDEVNRRAQEYGAALIAARYAEEDYRDCERVEREATNRRIGLQGEWNTARTKAETARTAMNNAAFELGKFYEHALPHTTTTSSTERPKRRRT